MDVVWRVTTGTNRRFNELLEELLATQEWSEPYLVLLDEIKSLPGFPAGYSERHDLIRVEVVDNPRVGYTGPGGN